MADRQEVIKLLIIGDGACGKTCLLDRFEKKEFIDDVYTPTVFHNTSVEMAHPEKPGSTFKMQLWDTAGQEEFEEARKVCYRGSNVVIVAFDIAVPHSLTSDIEAVWLKELQTMDLKGTPVIT